MDRRDFIKATAAASSALFIPTANALVPAPDPLEGAWWTKIQIPNDWKLRVYSRENVMVVPKQGKNSPDPHVVFRHIFHGREGYENARDIRAYLHYGGDKLFHINNFIQDLLDNGDGPGRLYVVDCGWWSVSALYCDMEGGYYPLRKDDWSFMDKGEQIMEYTGHKADASYRKYNGRWRREWQILT